MSIEAVVASGRRVVETTLLDTCTVRRRTLVDDTTGGKIETWADLVTGLACRFGTITEPDPQLVVDAVYGPPTAQVLLAVGGPVRLGDRILNEASDRLWLAVGSKTPDSAIAVVDRILIREV